MEILPYETEQWSFMAGVCVYMHIYFFFPELISFRFLFSLASRYS